ncbi:hypothetical protein [Streptomyces sp. NPDC056255]
MTDDNAADVRARPRDAAPRLPDALAFARLSGVQQADARFGPATLRR